MKTARIAPLIESVPPRLYGGTERIVSYLTEELVALGHEVTLFATGDSVTRGTLPPIVPRGLPLAPPPPTPRAGLRLAPRSLTPHDPQLLQLEQLMRCADDFDIIHFHNEPLHYP